MSRSWVRVVGLVLSSLLGFVACGDGHSSNVATEAPQEELAEETDEALTAAAEVNEGKPRVFTRAQVGALPTETWRDLDGPGLAAASLPMANASAEGADDEAPDEALQSPVDDTASEDDPVADGEDEPFVDPDLDAVNDTENAFPVAQ